MFEPYFDKLILKLVESGLEVSLTGELSRESILREYVEGVRDLYDYIIIDCMLLPSLGLWVLIQNRSAQTFFSIL